MTVSKLQYFLCDRATAKVEHVYGSTINYFMLTFSFSFLCKLCDDLNTTEFLHNENLRCINGCVIKVIPIE